MLIINANTPRVFIASPYTGEHAEKYVDRSIAIGNELIDKGFNPFIPLLFHYLELKVPRSHEKWMEITTSWLAQCDALIRLSGESRGADLEVKLAEGMGIPWFHSVDELVEQYKYG